MANFSYDDALANYEAAKTAYLNAVNVASYSIEGRSKSNQNIRQLRDEMEYWKEQMNDASNDNSGLIISQGAPKYDQ